MTTFHNASQYVEAVIGAAKEYGEAQAHESQLEDERCFAKRDAIRRIMQQPNEETSKPHSASSAEKVVETDAEYMAFRKKQREAVVATQLARGRFYAARLRAELEIVVLRDTAGAVG